ncbi:unnamed protein product [Oncorhynchus mykiss]|uniref:Urea transporter n=1 Tax=Oncorhynchus mykiss TaxID=8022 RepID=A0A060XTU7_ONCMY|nr:unnamed protein product [Oncorhynchus mykiss]
MIQPSISFFPLPDYYHISSFLLCVLHFLFLCSPIVSSALGSVFSKWDLPVFTLPFNILVCLHMAAMGSNHPYFPEVLVQPKSSLHLNTTLAERSIPQLLMAVPVGVGQVYGCDCPWTGGIFIIALLLSSPTICMHAVLGSIVGVVSGLVLAAPHEDIYSGLWGYNSCLSCIAIGGVFYALTWQSHLLAITCAFFCAYMGLAISNLMSIFGLPACTWPFCLSALTFLLITTESRAIHRLPLLAVTYPEENRRYNKEGSPENHQEVQQNISKEEKLLEKREEIKPHISLSVEIALTTHTATHHNLLICHRSNTLIRGRTINSWDIVIHIHAFSFSLAMGHDIQCL